MHQPLENIEGAIKNGQSRETGNIRYTRYRKKTNTLYVWHHYTQTNTNSAKIGRKDEPSIVLCGNRSGHHDTELRSLKHIIGQHKTLKD